MQQLKSISLVTVSDAGHQLVDPILYEHGHAKILVASQVPKTTITIT